MNAFVPFKFRYGSPLARYLSELELIMMVNRSNFYLLTIVSGVVVLSRYHVAGVKLAVGSDIGLFYSDIGLFHSDIGLFP